MYKGREKEIYSLNVVYNKTDDHVCRYSLSPLGVATLKIYKPNSLKVFKEVPLSKKIRDDILSSIKELIKGHNKDLRYSSSISMWASQEYIFFEYVDSYGSEFTIRWN